jgi:hypothetical protein
VSGVAAAILLSAACGKKGPPLAPFVRIPATITAVTPQRVGDDVYLSFTVPSTNVDGQKPADIGAVDVYAVTSAIVPTTERQRELATLIATLPVRPILPELPVPANGSPPPPLPIPPGVDRGAAVAVREPLTVEARVPVELPVEKPVRAVPVPLDTEPPFGTLVAPAPTQLPRRHYFVVPKSTRGREGTPSTPVSIPLEAGSSAPGAPVVTHTASELTITWPPSPDARSSTFLLPPTVKPVVTAANATPSNVTPKGPAPLLPLAAKSLGFNSVATSYHVYDVTPALAPGESPSALEGGPPQDPNPYDIKVPTPITAAPITETEFILKGVVFNVERCFEVRPVDQVFGAIVIGPASPRTCVTPLDTFPPAAPRSLAAIAGSGVISLIWDANTESDLAGYLVLRGEAPGDTLQPITPAPVTETSYRDETVRPGTRYVYAVVAVDRATPPNTSPQSNRAEETARQ